MEFKSTEGTENETENENGIMERIYEPMEENDTERY